MPLAGEGSNTPAVIEPLNPEAAIDLLMRDLNAQFAVVAEGGSTSVVRLAFNAELNGRVPANMTLDAFRLLFGTGHVQVPRKTQAAVLSTRMYRQPQSGSSTRGRRTCPDGCGIDPREISLKPYSTSGKASAWRSARVTGRSWLA